MNGNMAIAATFIQTEYSLMVTNVGGGHVTADDPGPYQLDDVVQLTAIPDPGWIFSTWSKDLIGSENPKSITIAGNMSVTATFTQIEYSLTLTQVGGGHVTVDNSGPYHLNDVVQLTAVPDAGWRFSAWNGDLIGTENPKSIIIEGDKAVIATFILADYSLTITTAGGGHVTADNPGPYNLNDQVELTAVPDSAGTSMLGVVTLPVLKTPRASPSMGVKRSQRPSFRLSTV